MIDIIVRFMKFLANTSRGLFHVFVGKEGRVYFKKGPKRGSGRLGETVGFFKRNK